MISSDQYEELQKTILRNLSLDSLADYSKMLIDCTKYYVTAKTASYHKLAIIMTIIDPSITL